MAKFDWENKNDIELRRTHNTKEFDLENGQRILIQSSGLLHAYTDKGFQDIEKELPDYNFPEGKIIKNLADNYIMDLPDWGEARVEENGKIVRVYDTQGVSIFRYSNPIVINEKKKPFKILSDEGIKIRETNNEKEQKELGETIVNNDGVDEVFFEIKDKKLHFKLPQTLKNEYPLKAYDVTDTASTNNRDGRISSTAPTTNYGSSAEMTVAYFTTPTRYRSLFNWTLSSGSGTISQISLFLFSYTFLGTTNANLHELTRDFTEAGFTWNTYDGTNNWTSAGGDYSATIVDVTTIGAQPPNTWAQWNLSGTDSDNPISGLTWGSTVKFLIKVASEATSDKGTGFSTKESASNKPYIQITYTVAGPANLKTWNGLTKASVKTFNNLGISSVKTINGLA